MLKDIRRKLRNADVEGSVIQTTVALTLDKVEKEMELCNGDNSEMFYTISKEDWERIKSSVQMK